MTPPEDPPERPSEVTRALAAVAEGEPDADRRLLELVYGELKRLAALRMAAQAPGHTLQPTALVHEACLRLLGRPPGDWEYRGSAHFFSAAAAAMRSILVDHARRRRAEKRGGGAERITLHPDLAGRGDPLERVLDVHAALDELAREHPRPARVVELVFFGGLAAEEAAFALGVSERTVKRDWRFARARLLRILGEE
jgi:RNA polymerase sigma factor (TIGR02999 family)